MKSTQGIRLDRRVQFAEKDRHAKKRAIKEREEKNGQRKTSKSGQEDFISHKHSDCTEQPFWVRIFI